jgi:cell wall-associated NlpC family hydrolase
VSSRFRAVGISALLGLALALFAGTAPAVAGNSCSADNSGGLSMSANDCKPIKKARIVNGKAVAPDSAPNRIKRVIKWANRIRNKRYVYGGGHASFRSRGYDCSGSVSYALRGGRFLKSPMPSGSFENWKKPGPGRWITTYANGGHMYMVVAGLSFDTSNMGGNRGNRWSTTIRSPRGFIARHPGNY